MVLVILHLSMPSTNTCTRSWSLQAHDTMTASYAFAYFESFIYYLQVTSNSFLHQCEDPAGRLSIVRTLLRFPACLPGMLAVPQTLKLTNEGATRTAYQLVTDDSAGRFPLFKCRWALESCLEPICRAWQAPTLPPEMTTTLDYTPMSKVQCCAHSS